MMSYDPNNTLDPRNMIRKCPHCAEIWINEEGCDGETTCGNRDWSKGQYDSPSTNTMPKYKDKYIFKLIDDLVEVIVNVIDDTI